MHEIKKYIFKNSFVNNDLKKNTLIGHWRMLGNQFINLKTGK